MAQRVVDGFEAVDVEHDDGELVAVALGAALRVGRPVR
jgi:hypothetical protein